MHDVYDEALAAASRWPERVALVDDEGAMTFAELGAEIVRLRDALVQGGLQPRQGLGVLARNGRDFVVGVFAGLGAGAVVMPISHQLTRAELDELLREAPLHAVLDEGSGITPLPGLPARTDLGRAWRLATTARPAHEPFVPHVPDAAFVRFTSGTTGRSKGVVISHRAVLERTTAAHEALALRPDDVVVWVLPMAYHFVVSIVMYVRFGVPFVVCRDMLAQTIVRCVQDHAGTVLYAAPTHYRMLAVDQSTEAVPTLRRAISTSAGIPREVALAFQARFGVAISQVYGIIEMGLPVGNLDACPERPEAIGRALPGYEVAILDDLGHAVPQGTIGHLALRGPGLFDGYLSPPQTAEQVLRAGWFHTGDLASLDADGIVTVEGRKKSMINAAGLKVFPEEVEAVIDAHPAVSLSRVYGEPHPLMGEVVMAELVPVPGVPLDTEAVRRWCRERLSMHKVPQRLFVVEAIQLTPTGKIARAG